MCFFENFQSTDELRLCIASDAAVLDALALAMAHHVASVRTAACALMRTVARSHRARQAYISSHTLLPAVCVNFFLNANDEVV